MLAIASWRCSSNEVGGVIECQVSNFLQQLRFKSSLLSTVTKRIVILVPGQFAKTQDEDNTIFSDSGRLEE